MILVMVFHSNIPSFYGDKLLQGGFIGVDIFFVLSGFLITFILVNEFDRSGTIRIINFFIKRSLRLGPALLVLVSIYCAASFFVLDLSAAYKNYIEAIITVCYMSNWARAFLYYPPDFLGHTWSLAIEWQFYLVWPFILLFALKITRSRVSLLIFVLSLATVSWFLRIYLGQTGSTIARLYNGLDTRVDGLMIGGALAVLLSSEIFFDFVEDTVSKYLPWLSWLSILVIVSIAFLGNWYKFGMHYWGFILVGISSGIVILDLTLRSSSFFGRLMRQKSLVWVGTISYGLYLWHYPIFRTVNAAGFHGMAKYGLYFGLTLFFTTLSYYFVELRFLRKKARLQ